MDWVLNIPYAPGDAWSATGLLRDFARQYPQHRLSLSTCVNAILEGNPYQSSAAAGAQVLDFRFGQEGRRYTYGNCDKNDTMQGAFYNFFNNSTGLKVERRFCAVDFFPNEREKRFSFVPLDKPVCIVNAGFKADNPGKNWGAGKFQRVIEALHDRIRFVQVGARRTGIDTHPVLNFVDNFVGKTTIRELAQLVYHADFVLTGVSQLHHISAIEAYKPRRCITIAGAREPENWANCYKRAGVVWHWLANNKEFTTCMEQGKPNHGAPGCWLGQCHTTPAPCMEAISAEKVISIFEENLK